MGHYNFRIDCLNSQILHAFSDVRVFCVSEQLWVGLYMMTVSSCSEQLYISAAPRWCQFVHGKPARVPFSLSEESCRRPHEFFIS
eukprot:949296-Amphidinium_carterae.1